jgi:hypothetical protein
LIAAGRLRRLESPEQVVLVKRAGSGDRARVRRDPAVFTKLLCSPVHGG